MNRSLVARFVLQLQDRASAGIGALQRRLQGLRQVAGRVALAGGLLGGLALAGPLRQAAAYDDALRQTAMTAGLSGAAVEASIARQGTAFEELARRSGQSSMDIAKAAGEMAAAGLDPTLAQSFLPILSRFATATGASMEDLGRVAIRLNQNLRITSVEEMTGALSSMLQASRDGSVEIADMARLFPSLTAQVEALGVRGRPAVDMLSSLLQVAARGAATASEAGTNVQNFLSKLTSPETVRNFREMGVSIEQVMQDAGRRGINPIEAIIQKVRELSGGNMFRVGELFGDMQVLNFLRPMLAGVPEYLSILRGAAAANESIINASFEDRWRGLTIQMSLVTEATTQMSRHLAANLLPAVRLVASGMVWLVEQYQAFGQAHPRLARNVTLLVAGIVALTTAAGLLGVAIGPIAAGFGLLASPIGLAIAAAAAFGLAAWAIYENWDGIVAWFGDLWTRMRPQVDWLVDVGSGAVALVMSAWSPVSTFFVGLWESLKSGAVSAGEGIMRGVSAVAEFLRPAWEGSPLQIFLSSVRSSIDGLVSLIERLQTAWNALTGSFARGDPRAAMSGFLGGDLLDQLFDAEFRGVPFHMPDAREETGRRVIRFLYPGRDDGDHADMGAFDGPMRVTGLIIGEDYIRRAQRMREAFRLGGPGLLVHPWLGPIDVVVSEAAEITFTDRRLRLASFTATFEPYIERPPLQLDTLGQLLAALDAIREGARSLLRQVLAPVRLALVLVGAVNAFASSFVSLYRTTIGAARGLVALPSQLGATYTGLLGIGTLTADSSYGATVAGLIAAPGAIVVTAGTRNLAPAIGGFAAPATSSTLIDTAAAARLMLVIASGIRADTVTPAEIRLAAAAMVLADAVQLGVQVDFVSKGEAVAMRTLLDTALVALSGEAALAAVADPVGAGDIWQGLQAVRAGLALDMSEILGRLPAIETLQLPVVAPTWLVAQHLVGDRPGLVVAQYEDLVARNLPPRPGQLPAGDVEVLR